MNRCTCAKDIETCSMHDWEKVSESPQEPRREREIRKAIRLSSDRKNKQEF